jgi:hypothetical protein
MRDLIMGVFLVIISGALLATSLNYERAMDNGRFQPVPSVGNMAVDTRHGQLCWLYDPLLKPGEKEVLFPLCKDIK